VFVEAAPPQAGELDVLQSSKDKDKTRRLRAETVEQRESIMELLSGCADRFKGIPADISAALTQSVSLPLEEQPGARRVVRDRMLRLLAPSHLAFQKVKL
jgi:hypothetical protein